MSKKHIAGMGAAIFILIAMFFIPPSENLPVSGIHTIGMVFAFLVVLITEALPMMLTCLIFLGLMPLIGVSPSFSSALSGFSNQVIFFILASFGIAAAFTTIPLSKRLLVALLRRFGKSVKSMLFALMACAALISAVVSNVPTCAIFMAIALSFLELYDDPDEKKRAGRAFMIAIPVASMIGGMMTPAGSSINLLAISLLEQHTGITITFVQWMAAGI
ncbi:MAG: anion permease, partial [Treponema sp.]|nr:anion permease [Treponema sp.]